MGRKLKIGQKNSLWPKAPTNSMCVRLGSPMIWQFERVKIETTMGFCPKENG